MFKPIAFVFAVLLAPAAHAGYAPLTGQQVLEQFNLVTMGTAVTSSHVDGRAYVGGDLLGTGAVAAMTSPLPTSNYAALTVFGNASGITVDNNYPSTSVGAVVGGNMNNAIVNNGGAAVTGSLSISAINGNAQYAAGSVSNVTGGTRVNLSSSPTLSNAVVVGVSTNFDTVMTSLSDQLDALTTNSSATVLNGTATFNAVADANGRAVFNLNASVLGASQFQFNLGSATTVIFNVDLTSVVISANFLNNSATGTLADIAVWNFNKATSVTLNNQFGGSVLAVNAALTNQNNVEGAVIVDTLNQQGEIHLRNFSGDVNLAPNNVPEPSSLALVALSLAGLGGLKFSRRRAHQGPALQALA